MKFTHLIVKQPLPNEGGALKQTQQKKNLFLSLRVNCIKETSTVSKPPCRYLISKI